MRFIINVFTLSIISIVIKILGLVNKSLLVRFIPFEAITYITLAMPTITFITTISGFQFQFSIAKLITNGYKSLRSVITKCFIFSTILSLIISLITISISRLISNLLNTYELYKIINSSVFLIFIISYQSILKGYLIGLNKVKTISFSNIIEQIFRIFLIYVLIYFFKPKNVIDYSILIILTNTLAELISLIFLIFQVFKITKLNFKIDKKKEFDNILKISIPSTISKIIICLLIFLEPIIFNLSLKRYGININKINYLFTVFHNFSIPILSLFHTVTMSIERSLLPVINKSNLNSYINKSINIILIPSIIITIIIYFYGDILIKFLFNSSDGFLYVKNMVIFNYLSFFSSIYITALNGLNKINYVLFYTTITYILELFLIYILSFINPIFSISYAYNITNIIIFFITIKKLINLGYKINIKRLLSIIISFLIAFVILSYSLNIILLIITILLVILINKFYINFKEISSDE